MSRSVVEVYASAARTATPTAVSVAVPGNATRVAIVIDATAIVTTPSITTTIRGVHPVSGTLYTILAGAAQTTVSHKELYVGPEFVDEANLKESAVLPVQLSILVTHGDADSITYSVYAIFE